MKLSQRLSHSAQRFCDFRLFDGFSFIANRRTVAELIVWLFLITIGIGFCVRDSIDLVATYRSQATIVSVKAETADAIRLDNFGICIQISRYDLGQVLAESCDETFLEM